MGKPENKENLVDVLTYHVLPVEVRSTQLKPAQRVTTVEGKPVQVFKDSTGVRVSPDGKDFKKVTAADNLASNGVVHIIDGVLLPSLVPTGPNIVELAESVKDLSTLVAAVVAGDLADTLSSPGPFTVFAPTSEAFKALPPGTFDRLMKPENKKELVDILTYHVLPEQVLSKDLKPFQAVKTVEGKPVHVTKWDGRVRVGASLESKDLRNVIKADNVASNGVVHIIDGVLLPPSSSAILAGQSNVNIAKLAESTPDLSILVSALVAADLVDTLSSPGPFTVFAPTDEAFRALPPGTFDNLMKPENKKQLVDLLTYHVVPHEYRLRGIGTKLLQTVEGKEVRVQKGFKNHQAFIIVNGDASAVSLDNLATNGVVHIIDKVLTVPSGPAPPSPGPPTPPPGTKNIVQLAESVSDLSTLVSAVVAGDLADTLSSPGPFTVFAPTNDAFKALPTGTFDRLMKPENKK